MTGGAGIAGVDPLAALAAASAAAPTSASRVNGEEGERRSVGRSMLEVADLSGGSLGERSRSSGSIVDRRNSDSLVKLPRLLRRNGMVSGGQDHHSSRTGWMSTASTHASPPAISGSQGRSRRCQEGTECREGSRSQGKDEARRDEAGPGKTGRNDKTRLEKGSELFNGQASRAYDCRSSRKDQNKTQAGWIGTDGIEKAQKLSWADCK